MAGNRVNGAHVLHPEEAKGLEEAARRAQAHFAAAVGWQAMLHADDPQREGVMQRARQELFQAQVICNGILTFPALPTDVNTIARVLLKNCMGIARELMQSELAEDVMRQQLRESDERLRRKKEGGE